MKRKRMKQMLSVLLSSAMLLNITSPAYAAEGDAPVNLRDLSGNVILEIDFDAEDITTAEGVTTVKGTSGTDVINATAQNVTFKDGVAEFAGGDTPGEGVLFRTTADNDPMKKLTADSGATISMWIKTAEENFMSHLFAYESDAAERTGLAMVAVDNADGDAYVYSRVNGNTAGTPKQKIVQNDQDVFEKDVWQLVTYVEGADGSETLYVDGEVVGSLEPDADYTSLFKYASADDAATTDVKEGYWSNNTYYIGTFTNNENTNFKGQMDSLTIYNMALTQTEVQSLYAEKAALVAYESTVASAKKIIDAGQGNYTDASWDAFDKAYAQAIGMNMTEATDEGLTAAATALKAAQDALVMNIPAENILLSFDFDAADIATANGATTVKGTAGAAQVEATATDNVSFYGGIASFGGGTTLKDGILYYPAADADPMKKLTEGTGATISMWIKPEGEDFAYDLFAYETLAEENRTGFQLHAIDKGGESVFSRVTGSTGAGNNKQKIAVNSTDIYKNGAWQLVTYVENPDGSEILYIDGKKVGELAAKDTFVSLYEYATDAYVTTANAAAVGDTNKRYAIGTAAEAAKNGTNFEGLMDSIAIYNKPLTENEILSMYNAGVSDAEANETAAVKAMLNALPAEAAVTSGSEAVIVAARAAYNRLNATQTGQVTTEELAKLTAAEAALAAVLKPIATADLQTAITEAQEEITAGQRNYTDASWKRLQDAYAAATTVDEDSATTEELTQLTDELVAAKMGLMLTVGSENVILNFDFENSDVGRDADGNVTSVNGNTGDGKTVRATANNVVISDGFIEFMGGLDVKNGVILTTTAADDPMKMLKEKGGATINLWVKSATEGFHSSLFAYETTAEADRTGLEIQGADKGGASVYSRVNGDTEGQKFAVNGNDVFKKDTWQLVTYIENTDGSEALYVDGVQVGELGADKIKRTLYQYAFDTYAADATDTDKRYSIGTGAEADDITNFEGLMKSVTVYNRALTETEILEICGEADTIEANEILGVIILFDRLSAADAVTLDNAAAIDVARGAYERLSDAQKAEITQEDLKKLTDAEEALADAELAAAKTTLNDELTAAKAMYDAENTDYTDVSWNAFKTAYEAAADVDQATATTAEIEEAINNLKIAQNALLEKDEATLPAGVILSFDFNDNQINGNTVTGIAGGMKVTAQASDSVTFGDGVATFAGGATPKDGILYYPTGDTDPMKQLTDGGGASITMWVKSTTDNFISALFCYETTAETGRTGFQIDAEDNGGNVYSRINGYTTQNGGQKLTVTGTDLYKKDVWQLVTFVEEADGSESFYIDDVKVGTLAADQVKVRLYDYATSDVYDAAKRYCFGTSAEQGKNVTNFEGSIGNVRVYNIPLTEARIKEMYTEGAEGLTPLAFQTALAEAEACYNLGEDNYIEGWDALETAYNAAKNVDVTNAETDWNAHINALTEAVNGLVKVILDFEFETADVSADGATVKGTSVNGDVTATLKNVTVKADDAMNGVAVFPGDDKAANGTGILYTPEAGNDPMASLVNAKGATIAMWIKTSEENFSSPLFSYGAVQTEADGGNGAGSLGASIQIQGRNKQTVKDLVLYRDYKGNANGQKLQATVSPYKKDTWQLVTFVENPDASGTLYVDGVKIGDMPAKDAKTLLGFANDGREDTYFIGLLPNESAGDTHFVGEISSVAIYDKALTNDQIIKLYDVHADDVYAGLLAAAKTISDAGKGNYTDASWSAFETAYTAATKEGAQEADYTALRKAMDELEEKLVNANAILEFDFSKTNEAGTEVYGTANGKEVKATATNVTFKDGVAEFKGGNTNNNGIVFDPVDAEDPMKTLTANGGATISMWIKTTTDGFSSPLFLYEADNTENRTGLQIHGKDAGGETVFSRVNNGTNNQKLKVEGTDVYKKDIWQLVTYVENANGSETLYIDGKVAGTFEAKDGNKTLYQYATNAEYYNNNKYFIGTYAALGDDTNFTGYMDSIAIYNRPLTEDEVQKLYSEKADEIAWEVLNQAVEAAEKLDEGSYTANSWMNFEDALDAAKYALKHSTDADDLTAYVNDLLDAQDALVKNVATPILEFDFADANGEWLTGKAGNETATAKLKNVTIDKTRGVAVFPEGGDNAATGIVYQPDPTKEADDPMKKLVEGNGAAIVMWVKNTADAVSSPLFTYGALKSNTELGASLQIQARNGDKKGMVFYRNQESASEGQNFTPKEAISPYQKNVWQLVAFVEEEDGSGTLYIDGVEIGKVPVGTKTLRGFATDANTPDKYYIGYLPYEANGDTHFTGEMDSVVLYNMALTADEVKALYDEKADKIAWDALQAALEEAGTYDRALYTGASWNVFDAAYRAADAATEKTSVAELKRLREELVDAQNALERMNGAQQEILKFDFSRAETKDGVTSVYGTSLGTEIKATAKNVTIKDGVAVFAEGGDVTSAGITYAPGANDPMKKLLSGDGMAVAMWIKTTSDTISSPLFSYGTLTAAGTGLGASLQVHARNGAGDVVLYRDQNGSTGTGNNKQKLTQKDEDKPYKKDTWQLVTYVEEPDGSGKLYVDGTAVGTLDVKGKTVYGVANDANTPDTYYIGYLPFASENDTHFTGEMTSLVVYDKSLTDTEVMALYNKEKTQFADAEAANAVISAIDAIGGTVTVDKEADITAARAAYNALTDAQKALVPADTLKKLTDAEAALATAKAQKELADAKAALANLVAAEKATYDAGQQNYTDDSWAAYKDAYEKATAPAATATVAELTTLKTNLETAKANLAQKQVDEALEAAKAALANLVAAEKATYDAGQQNYTDASWAAYKDAYEKAVAPAETATAAELTALKTNLETAKAALAQKQEDPELANAKAALKTLVEAEAATYNAGKQSYNTDDSWAAYKDAYEKAAEPAADATTAALTELKSKLETAKAALEQEKQAYEQAQQAYADAKAALKELVDAETATYRAGNKNYTADSWKTYKEAYENAASPATNATTAELTELKDKLAAAKAGLTEIDNELEAAKAALKELVDAEKTTYEAGRKNYTEDSWNTYKAAYNDAAKPAADATAAELNELKSKLETAKAGLKEQVDEQLVAARTALDTAIAAAKATYDAGQKDYTDATWKAFADAYKKATAASGTATAADLNGLKSALETAQKALVKKQPIVTPPTVQLTDDEKKIADKFGVAPEVAKQIATVVAQYGISDSTLSITDKTITALKTENDVKGSDFTKLLARATKQTKTSVKLKWNKVSGADGYLIYGNKCGKGNAYKLLKDITNGKTTTYTQKKLKKGTAVKYIVIAYKKAGGTKVTLAASKTIHTVTKGGKNGVAKAVSVKSKKVNLKVKKTFKLGAKEVRADKKIKQHRKIAYESTDTSIATVDKNGKIKAKKKGTCYVYAYAQNGVFAKVKVTVKK